MRPLAWLWIAVVVTSGGCAGSPKLHTFPAAWPPSLEVASRTGPAPAQERGPAVGVDPFILDIGEPAPGEEFANGRPTREVLTMIFVEKLRASGVVVAVPEKAPYLFRAAVPALGYTVRGGYPGKITYFYRMVYQLIHRDTGTVVWNGNVEQDFEQTVLVNTMTHLPSDPNAPERVLLEKCIEPAWKSVAEDLGAYLKAAVREDSD